MVTNKQQDYTEYEPEDGCFAAPRGWVSAAKKKPAIRRIKGASGDLYDPKSKAHRLALNQLAELLREIGFVVECHKDETTLRVYPTKRHQYPLLNPGFECWADGSEFLGFTVYSQGDESKRGTMPCDRDTLDQHLKTFTSDHGCFNDDLAPVGKYCRHGNFNFLLRFKADKIDFEALYMPLRNLLQFLDEEKMTNERQDLTKVGWDTTAPVTQVHVEWIEGFIETRGRHRVYGRSEHFGGDRIFNMDIWKARNGRLLMQCWSDWSEIDWRSFEITGVDVSAIPARDKEHGLTDSWIPKDVREAYENWIYEEFC